MLKIVSISNFMIIVKHLNIKLNYRYLFNMLLYEMINLQKSEQTSDRVYDTVISCLYVYLIVFLLLFCSYDLWGI